MLRGQECLLWLPSTQYCICWRQGTYDQPTHVCCVCTEVPGRAPGGVHGGCGGAPGRSGGAAGCGRRGAAEGARAAGGARGRAGARRQAAQDAADERAPCRRWVLLAPASPPVCALSEANEAAQIDWTPDAAIQERIGPFGLRLCIGRCTHIRCNHVIVMHALREQRQPALSRQGLRLAERVGPPQVQPVMGGGPPTRMSSEAPRCACCTSW